MKNRFLLNKEDVAKTSLISHNKRPKNTSNKKWSEARREAQKKVTARKTAEARRQPKKVDGRLKWSEARRQAQERLQQKKLIEMESLPSGVGRLRRSNWSSARHAAQAHVKENKNRGKIAITMIASNSPVLRGSETHTETKNRAETVIQSNVGAENNVFDSASVKEAKNLFRERIYRTEIEVESSARLVEKLWNNGVKGSKNKNHAEEKYKQQLFKCLRTAGTEKNRPRQEMIFTKNRPKYKKRRYQFLNRKRLLSKKIKKQRKKTTLTKAGELQMAKFSRHFRTKCKRKKSGLMSKRWEVKQSYITGKQQITYATKKAETAYKETYHPRFRRSLLKPLLTRKIKKILFKHWTGNVKKLHALTKRGDWKKWSKKAVARKIIKQLRVPRKFVKQKNLYYAGAAGQLIRALRWLYAVSAYRQLFYEESKKKASTWTKTQQYKQLQSPHLKKQWRHRRYLHRLSTKALIKKWPSRFWYLFTNRAREKNAFAVLDTAPYAPGMLPWVHDMRERLHCIRIQRWRAYFRSEWDWHLQDQRRESFLIRYFIPKKAVIRAQRYRKAEARGKQAKSRKLGGAFGWSCWNRALKKKDPLPKKVKTAVIRRQPIVFKKKWYKTAESYKINIALQHVEDMAFVDFIWIKNEKEDDEYQIEHVPVAAGEYDYWLAYDRYATACKTERLLLQVGKKSVRKIAKEVFFGLLD